MMKEEKEKKKFKDTKVGQFLRKAGKVLPDALDVVLDSGGNPLKAVNSIVDKLREKAETNEEAKILLLEYEREKREFERDYELSILGLQGNDRADARAMQNKALSQDDRIAKLFLYGLATLMMLATIGFGIALFSVEIPEPNKRMVEMFSDVFLFSGAIMVLNFFFGGSLKTKFKNQSETA